MASIRKLTDSEVLRIRERHAIRARLLEAAEDMTIASLARQFGVSYSTADGVVNGDT
jgi:DNA-directed RNA polymerase sigma subunit (sigma70/sigma32)